MGTELITTEKKPMEIILAENKKIREYPVEARIGLATEISVELLDMLGVGGGSNEDHHIRAIKFIAECLLNYTKEEIIHAVNMALTGEFEIKLYQQLNAVVLGTIMREYELHKRKKVITYNKTKKVLENGDISEIEKERIMLDAVTRCEQEVKKHGQLKTSAHHVYDFLEKSGRAEFLKVDKVREYKKVKEAQVAKLELEALGDLDRRKSLKGQIKRINEGKDGTTITETKHKLVERFFIKKGMGLK